MQMLTTASALIQQFEIQLSMICQIIENMNFKPLCKMCAQQEATNKISDQNLKDLYLCTGLIFSWVKHLGNINQLASYRSALIDIHQPDQN